MRATPVVDAYTRRGTIRADGRLVHDLYLMRVKAPEQSKGPWDLWEQVEVQGQRMKFGSGLACR